MKSMEELENKQEKMIRDLRKRGCESVRESGR